MTLDLKESVMNFPSLTGEHEIQKFSSRVDNVEGKNEASKMKLVKWWDLSKRNILRVSHPWYPCIVGLTHRSVRGGD